MATRAPTARSARSRQDKAGRAIRAPPIGGLEPAAAILRRLAELDPPAGVPDLAIGGLDEVVVRTLALATNPDRTATERARAAGATHGTQRTVYVLTGKRIRRGLA